MIDDLQTHIVSQKHAEQEIEEKSRLLALYAEIGRCVSQHKTLPMILQGCAETLVTVLDAAFARIWTLDANQSTLVMQASAGMYTHLDGAHSRIPLGQMKIGTIAHTRTPHLSNSVIGDPLVGNQEWAQREQMIAFAGYPLIVGDELVGVMALFARRPLSPAILQMMASVADVIAVSIKQTQTFAELSKSEIRLQTALFAGEMAAFDVDILSDEMTISESFSSLFGLSPELKIAKSVDLQQYIHSQDWILLEAAKQECFRGDTSVFNHQFRTLGASGEFRWLEVKGRLLTDEAGHPARITGVVMDITRRKTDESRLHMLEAAVENANDVFLISEAEPFHCPGPRVIYVNEAFTRMTGYAREEIIGQSPRMLQGPNTDPATRAMIRDNLARWKSFQVEVLNYRKDGSEFWAELNIRPIANKTGWYTHWIAVQRDITARKQAEAVLNQLLLDLGQSYRQAEMLLASLSSLLIGVDHAGIITRWNATAEKVFGMETVQALGQPFRECGIQWDWAKVDQAIAECIETGQKTFVENLCYVNSEGEERLFGLTLNPFKDDGEKTVGFLLAGADVTERRRAERALRESEECLRVALQELEGRNWELAEARDVAVAAARLKSEFLANTSHEVRTPLNGIMGMTHLLLSTDTDDRQRKWLQTIKYSADALLTILNDILDFSKIEAGKMTLETVDFSLRGVIEDCAALLTGKAQEKHIALRCLLPAPDAHPFAESLSGDPGRLRQILINLLGNAIKFTDAGGQVTVGADLLTETEGQARWKVWVQDTGIGIPLEKQASIFESFTQADGSTTRRYGGTGLGLTISRQLVQLMEGTMGLHSEAGKGSTFYFELTLDKGTSEEPALTLSASSGGSAPVSESGGEFQDANDSSKRPWTSARLLLAEDNPINQMVITGMLTNCGFASENVVLTASGRECLNALREAAFDLILMDMQMPDMDGTEAVKHIRAEDRQTGRTPVPIVAMTAHCMAGDRERLLALGMDDYLAKPIDFQQLKRCLARWLRASEDTPPNAKAAQSAPPVDAPRPLLDEKQLAASTGGSAELAQRLLTALVTSAPKMLIRCSIALEMEDGPGLEHWAHTLKGSCSTLGAWTLTPLCQQLENLGKKNSFEKAGRCLSQLEAEWDKVFAIIEERLTPAAAAAGTISSERDRGTIQTRAA